MGPAASMALKERRFSPDDVPQAACASAGCFAWGGMSILRQSACLDILCTE